MTTRTRVLLLRHPRERGNAIGTAEIAHRALPGSVLRTDVDFSSDTEVQALLGGPAPAYVLFPGRGAIPVEALPPAGPLTVVVLDGTWWQAGKLLRRNPLLACLPRVGFTPRAPSAYRIRRQPAVHCVSTIEALAELLRTLEPDGARFDALLAPFRAMVDRQLHFIETVRAARHRHPPRPPRDRGPTLPQRLAELGDRLVLVQGEANAWPRRSPARPADELVHLVAWRPLWRPRGQDDRAGSPTNAPDAAWRRFEAIVRPGGVLAPSTARYIDVPAERLLGGEPANAARARWTGFLRPDDVLVSWGHYHLGLARTAGWAVPGPPLDLRNALSQHLRRRLGTVDAAAETLDAQRTPGMRDAAASAVPRGAGRAFHRLAALGRVVSALLDEATVSGS